MIYKNLILYHFGEFAILQGTSVIHWGKCSKKTENYISKWLKGSNPAVLIAATVCFIDVCYRWEQKKNSWKSKETEAPEEVRN
jgi:hypothetical protein